LNRVLLNEASARYTTPASIRRGAPPVAIDRYSEMAAEFSAMVAALKDDIQELDANPVIVSENSCIAVDALIVGRTKGD
jgi:hypothetical protein